MLVEARDARRPSSPNGMLIAPSMLAVLNVASETLK